MGHTLSTPGGGLEELLAFLRAEAGAGRAVPPVERWNPEFCGVGGFEILRDGSWRHEGVRITREALVRLFATILRKEADGRTFLVTPGEKILVEVEDAPFLGIRLDRVGEGRGAAIVATTNVGDVVTLGPEHPLRVAVDSKGAPRPYVLVRGRLEARILRAPFYELVEWAEERQGRLGVWSGGAWFDLGDPSGEQA
ncbi:MAG: DUF1285 domain-containing protein [Hyphomonadaceae bacterium]